MSDAFAASPVTRAVGLALVQFIWQGLVIGIVTGVTLFALRRSSAHVRYVAACAGLAAMCILPVALTARDLGAGSRVVASARLDSPAAHAAAVPTEPGGVSVLAAGVATKTGTWIEPRLPFVVAAWFAGVLLFALQLLRGWLRVGRVSQHGQAIIDGPWPAVVRRVGARMMVATPVRLIASTVIRVPSVVGILRPAIVVPVSVLSGLPPSSVEAILAHELAHVRRRDPLVNAMQCVAEVLLFYHPAVWWVSKQIRLERENCCDDVAATLCGDRVEYARALASLETLRARTPALAMAADGGDLLSRIRRLVEPGASVGPSLSGSIAAGLVLLVLVGAAVQSRPLTAAQATPAPTPAPVPKPELAPAPVAQAGLGRIAGTITDDAGGVIPGVTVTATNSSGTHTAMTNGIGQFVLADLVAGDYDLGASLTGFKTLMKTHIQVSSNAVTNDVLTLHVGGITDVIKVTGTPGQAAPAETATAVGMTTADDFFTLAERTYRQGLFLEAERLTARALELYRAANPEPPRDINWTALPAAGTAGVRAIRVGGDIVAPRQMRRVEPLYPASAIDAKVSGTVRCEAIVGRDGTVKSVKIVQSIPMLDDPARVAVEQWLYTPTKLNGDPVEVNLFVEVRFAIK